MTLAAGRDDVALKHDDTQFVRLEMSRIGYESFVAALCADRHYPARLRRRDTRDHVARIKHEKIANLSPRYSCLPLTRGGLDYEHAGSSTFRRKPVGGFEGDASFYVANAEKIRGLQDIDLRLHPAPDLILEVDISNRRKDKKAIYEACGVTALNRDIVDQRIEGSLCYDLSGAERAAH